MVEAIGSNVGRVSDRRIATVTRIAATPPAPASVAPETTVTVAPQLSARPPVDTERVRAIRTAIENGTFPISPATIADRLIAARYEWMNDDAA